MRLKAGLYVLAYTFVSLLTGFQELCAQGKIKLEGYTVHTDSKGKKSAIADMNIHVYRGADKTDEYRSNKKGRFDFQLEYGAVYKVALEGNEGYIDMCFMVDGKIPAAKQTINPTISIDFVLIDKDNTSIDTLKFKFPFTKFKFDGDKKFIDDAKYLNDFTKGMFKEYVEAKKQIKKQEADKALEAKANAGVIYFSVGGKLLAGDPPSAAVDNRKILLKDEKGNTVETVSTDKYGKFSFTKLAPDRNYSVVMDESDSLGFSGKKITLYNKYGKELLVSTSDKKGNFKFQLLASDKAVLSQLKVEDNNLLIGGALEALINGKTQAVAKIRITLANSLSGEIYETIETDENGKFVFTKLPPDKNFVIRMEEASPELANVKITIKDRKGNEIASGRSDGFGKFRFQLLASDKVMMNSLEVEENDTRMDLIGKFLNGENNIPLGNIKVDLLDDRNQVLQTTLTNGKGIFLFKNLTLYSGYFFKLDEKDPGISGLSSLLLAETTDKPVKEYKIEANQALKRRILASDQGKLGRLYLK